MAGFPFIPSYPFYTGAGISSLTGTVTDCVPNTITLDGLTFPVELNHPEAQWRSGPLDTFRDTIVANDQPNDSLFNARGAWARYRFSWHHGSGQSLGDFDENADAFRFLSSHGLKWHDKYSLTMAPSCTNNRTVTSAAPVLCQSGIYVFGSDGTALYRTTDLITWTAMTVPGGTVQAMTSDGTDLYVATTTGVVKYVGSGTTPTAFATPVVINTDNIAFCSNRLLVGQGNLIKELAAAGTYVSTIKTHFQAAFRWTTIFNIGSRIYIGGFAGVRSELHTVTTDSAGTLVQSQEAAPLPGGELLRAGVSYAGAAILCTSNGVRVAEVSGDGTLTYGPLIDELGDVRCACADGRYVFAGWSVMPNSASGVARLVMDDEVASLQPAYGQDILETTDQDLVTGVVRFNGKTCFAVSAEGFFCQDTTSLTSGYMEAGKFAFGTVEPKGLVTLTLTTTPLPAGSSVSITVYDDNDVLVGEASTDLDGETNLDLDLEGAQVSFTRVKISMTGTAAAPPTIKRWRMRAYPIPPPALQWVLPLIAHERVEVNIGEGQVISKNIEDVHTWVEDLAATRRLSLLRVGTRQYRVRLETFEWRARNWTDNGGGPQGLLVVQLIAT